MNDFVVYLDDDGNPIIPNRKPTKWTHVHKPPPLTSRRDRKSYRQHLIDAYNKGQIKKSDLEYYLKHKYEED